MLSRRLIRWAHAVSAPTPWWVVLLVGLGCGLPCSGCKTATANTPATQTGPTEPERSDPSETVYKHGKEKIIVKVGSSGARLELENGARLEIPEDALDDTVEITFAEGQHTTAFSNHEYERPVGPLVEVAPALNLSKPFKLSVPLTSLPEGFTEKDLTLAVEVLAENQRAVQGQGTQTRWDYLPASSKSERAVAELAQVSGFRMQFVVSKGN